jgi:hypothetical protein
VWRVLYHTGQGVVPGGVIDTDETAFLLYPHGFYTWARRGAHAVQIRVAGNEKQFYTVMVAVTMDGGKLSSFIIVLGKTVRCEWRLEQAPFGSDASTHSTTGWMTVEAMLRWLQSSAASRSMRTDTTFTYSRLLRGTPLRRSQGTGGEATHSSPLHSARSH